MSFSFEKFQSGRSGALGAIWESLAKGEANGEAANEPHRSNSGGIWSGLLSEWSHVSASVRTILNSESPSDSLRPLNPPTVDTTNVERRLSFLGWDFDSRFANRRTFKLRDFADIYFNELGFRPAKGEADPDSTLLDTVLAKREGTFTSLATLFAWGADRAIEKWRAREPDTERLKFDLIQDAPTDVIRVTKVDSSVEYVSMKSKGQIVEDDEWLEWCSEHPSLQRLSLPEVWMRLLNEMKTSLDVPSTRWTPTAALTAQNLILDQLISFKPSHIRWLAERAVIRHRLGNDSGALDDLKRFFAFQERDAAPPSLVSLYEQLR